jgi:rod shape-determining protein MreC
MNLLQRLPTREIAFVVVLLAAAILIGKASGRTAVLTEILSPVWGVTQSVVNSVRGGASYVQDLEHTRRENAQFRTQIAAEEGELTRLREVDAENKRLAALLSLAQTTLPHGLAARVVARSPSNWQQRLVIDRGAGDGVGVDSVVLSPRGLVGRVLVTSPHTSVVSLLTDPGQTVGVLNQRSRSPGVVMGEGDTSLVLQYLPQQVDFRVGDAVVTSGFGTAGFGSVYPKGVNVGRVVRVDQQPNAITPKVTIVLSADLDRLEEVLVLPPLVNPARS